MESLYEIRFVVEGEPFGWQRAGQNRRTGATYTQVETRRREREVELAYRNQCGWAFFGEEMYVDLKVIAYMKIPKSANKTTRTKMLEGIIRPAVKPDWDNIGKLIADALNGVAYKDDKCIVNAAVSKRYSDHPRTEVILEGYRIE